MNKNKENTIEFQHLQVLICLYIKAKRIIDLIFISDHEIVNHHEKPMKNQWNINIFMS